VPRRPGPSRAPAAAAPRAAGCQLAVVIPVAVVELDEANAALGQPAGEQAVGRERPVPRHAAVEREGPRVLAPQVEQVGHASLQTERQLVLRDAGGELGVGSVCAVQAVEGVDRADVRGLPAAVHAGRVGEVVHRLRAAMELHALESAGQETAAPLARGHRLRGTARSGRDHHHEARQVLRLAAEPVVDPRAHARPAGDLGTRVHEHMRRVVVDRLGGHRAHEADVVHDGAEVRKERADLGAVAAEALEGELGRVAEELLPLQLRELLAPGEALGHRLAVHRRQPRLRIEGLELRGPARHRQPDDAPHALRQGQRVDGTAGRGGAEGGAVEQGRQRHAPHALGGAAEEGAAGEVRLVQGNHRFRSG